MIVYIDSNLTDYHDGFTWNYRSGRWHSMISSQLSRPLTYCRGPMMIGDGLLQLDLVYETRSNETQPTHNLAMVLQLLICEFNENLVVVVGPTSGSTTRDYSAIVFWQLYGSLRPCCTYHTAIVRVGHSSIANIERNHGWFFLQGKEYACD